MELNLINADIKHFNRCDTFGELALIQKNKRSGTVKCVDSALIFYLDGTIFRYVIQKLNATHLKDRLFFLSLIPIFK